MLPVEGIFFVPSLFITPIAVAVLLRLRRGSGYIRVWRSAVFVCILLTVTYTALTLATPLYSERDLAPDNPGGFSVSVGAVMGEFILWTCLAVPAFPILVVLAFLPPPGRSRRLLWALPLLVLLLTGLIGWKHVRYVADFRHEKTKPRQSTFERFKHLRDNPADATDDAN